MFELLAARGRIDADHLPIAFLFSIAPGEACTEPNAIISWELGTREEALTELNARNFSVLNGSSVPPKTGNAVLQPIFEIVATVISNNTHGLQNNTPAPFIPDGSAADPASNGVAALLANWTGQNNGSINFGLAAVNQMNFLWTQVPRTSDGALSHRVAEVQLWYVCWFRYTP